MKRIVLLPMLIVLVTSDAFSQEFQKPHEGKSLVYFVRYGGAVALIDFRYFDGNKYLGKSAVEITLYMNVTRVNMFFGLQLKTKNLSRVN